MPGQYTKLKERYGPPPVEDERKQAKINAVKATLPKTPSDLGTKYFEFRAAKDKLKEELSDADTNLQAVEQLLVDWLESSRISSFKLPDGNLLYIQDTVYCSVKDREAFHQWVRDTHQEELFSVHYSTMNSHVGAMCIRGEQEPPGVKVHIVPRIRPRKA